jgi:hypothetical protein
MLWSCNKEPKKIMPLDYLSKTEIDSFNYKIIRYIQRLPKYATEENKFESKFDEDYKNSLKDCSLMYLYKDNKNTIYFAISKIAPSIKLKKTATVGKLKLDNNDAIMYYEEAFRTWKMEPKELETKTKLLFTTYINNEDLKPYYTVNSNPEFYIEFPDEQTYYDTLNRIWKIKN